MINSNKILEAVNRGIKLALDDYEDIESIGSVSSVNDVIKNEEAIKGHINFWNQWIDLGLPSGTLWARYNIGVDIENLEHGLDEVGIFAYFGKYYSWGETGAKKDKGDWKSYKFSQGGSAQQLLKYVSNENYAYNKATDNLKQLEPIDDIAYLTYHNSHIRIPTQEQIEELVQYTLHQWVQDFNGIKNLDGCMFTSFNDMTKYIFIPAAGYRSSEGLGNIQKLSGIWSSTQSHDKRSDLATALIMSNSRGVENEVEIEYRYRCAAFSIRAVYNK